MAEKDILSNIQNAARDDLDFFSNKGKPEREQWVIAEFLNKLGVSFKESDIVSLPQQNKIDVKFGTANFQVKEIVDPGILRTREAKENYLAFKDAKSLSDIKLPPSHGRDVPDVTRMYDLVLDESSNLADSPNYKDIKNEIDLIFYVTRTRSSIIQSEEINIEDFQQLGWRSISCLNTKQAIVLFVSYEAPGFLKNQINGYPSVSHHSAPLCSDSPKLVGEINVSTVITPFSTSVVKDNTFVSVTANIANGMI